MTDSTYKDMADLLNAGTWTAKPGIIQVTKSTDNLKDLAIQNQSNSGCLILMPPTESSDYAANRRMRILEFEVHIYQFGFVRPDTKVYEFEDLWADLASVLAAAIVSGYDDNYLANWVNLTDRSKDYCKGVGFIRLEDWIV